MSNFATTVTSMAYVISPNVNCIGPKGLNNRLLAWSSSVLNFSIFFRKQFAQIRFWWMFSMSVSFYLCVHFVNKSFIQWFDNPVSLSYSERSVSIAQIPFPTVTICPETKSLRSEFDLTAQIASLTESQSNANLSETE